MKKTNSLINIIILHVISIIGVTLYFFSSALLYPIGYFVNIILFFLIFSVIGIFFIYKKPNLAKNLFTITITGAFLTVLSYILTTEQDWVTYTFIFVLLGLSCIFLLLSIYFLKKI